jgi:hypothetical protein
LGVALAAVMLIAVVRVPTVLAQQQHISPNASTALDRTSLDSASLDSASLAAAWAQSDTGRMIPGYRDISRYDTPGYCLAAIETITEETWRKGEHALVVEGSPQDTLPTKAVTIGKQCFAHLPDVQHVNPLELGNMERLAIVLGDSVALNAAIDRHLAVTSDTSDRAAILSTVFNELAYARSPVAPYPRQFAWANIMLARLDAMGPSALLQQLEAHETMAKLMTTVRFDTTALLREDTVIRRLRTLLPEQERGVSQALLMDSLLVAWYRNDPDLKTHVRATMTRELQSVTKVRPELKELVVASREANAARIGTPAAPLTGEYWFPSDKPHVAPEPGKVTLITRMQKGKGQITPDLAMLHRLYDKYHAAGLEIVLVLQTEGHSWASPPQTADDEAKTIAWYFLDHLGLPFTIVIYKTPFTKKPDGRIVPGDIPFSKDYQGTTLVGRDGRIRAMGIGLSGEDAISAYIEQELAKRGKMATK